MQGVREQFVDSFLATCRVEIFSPAEEILQRNSISSDRLYLLVGGVVELLPSRLAMEYDEGGRNVQRKTGEFINEVGFFTESPQINTVRTVTVCKTLTMSSSAYKLLAQDHPGSAGKILQNLLSKVERVALDMDELRVGSALFRDDESSGQSKVEREALLQTQTRETVKDLVKMHINKQKDDNTTLFLFAASRGDINTIALMCDQGFDPDSADYDSRTALMVAAMKGNTDVVRKLLEYDADPNLVDMHGSSALFEAVRKGHEATMDELIQNSARLCTSDSLAASILCQAVFDGNVLLLRRLLQAKIQVNASDYDKRAAVHIAAAEGNVAALKVMVEFGADLTVKDRWGNTVEDEAKAARAGQLVEYLKALKHPRHN